MQLFKKLFKNKTTIQKKKDHKLSIFMFFFLGFSYTCGGALFTIAFASNISDPQTGIGYYIFIAIFLGAFLIGGTSLAYSKCSKVFYKSNGSGYIYVRSTLGRFWGWMAGVFQYVTLPTSVVVAIVAIIDQNFGPLIPDTIPLIGNGKPYAHLILNLISLIIFALLFFVLYFGMKWIKIAATFASILQWGTTFIVTIFAIIWCFNSNAAGFKPSKTSFSLLNFNSCIITFIYFYVGFESFSATSNNVRTKNKSSIGKVIFAILITVFIFYMILTFIFIFALGVDNFENYSTQTKSGIQPMNAIFKKFGKIYYSVGIALTSFTIIGTRLNSIILSGFYSSAILQPLAREHYINDKFKKLNREKISIKSCFLHTLITIILTLGIVIIPNILKDDIDVSSVINFSSLFTIAIYILVIIATLKLEYEKKIFLNIIEKGFLYISAIAMVWIGFFYFYNLFYDLFYDSDNLTIYIMQIVMLFGSIMFAIIWYFAYYIRKYNLLLKTKPELITENEHFFIAEKYQEFEKKFALKNEKIALKKQKKLSKLNNNS